MTINRRLRGLRCFGFWTAGLCALLTAGCAQVHSDSAAPAPSGHGASAVSGAVSPDEAWSRLAEGNKRYVSGSSTHPHQDRQRREEVAKGQHPFAIVLACADSRTSPEIVFDTGLGDLFVVRVAGNVIDDDLVGSIEYAVEHLGSSLIVVLGHERCGAVKAAVELAASGGKAPAHVAAIVEKITPAVAATKDGAGDPLDRAIDENVLRSVETLRASQPLLAHAVAEGKVKVVGARYDLDTGEVAILQRHGTDPKK